uniref:Uncharacterized protein n=1 Tax=Setaria italica TaxID=4555 RepID=K3YKJ7_SETIT
MGREARAVGVGVLGGEMVWWGCRPCRLKEGVYDRIFIRGHEERHRIEESKAREAREREARDRQERKEASATRRRGRRGRRKH